MTTREKSKKSKKASPAVHRKGQQKKAKLGKPLRPSFTQNCLGCFNFYNCRNPDKGRAFLCSKFSDIEDFADELSGPVEEPEVSLSRSGGKKRKKADGGLIWTPPEDGSEESLEQFFLDMIKNPSGFGEEDFIFDDRDLPLANNFLQFAASKKFLGEKPYPKQVEIGINLYQEYCPRCSDIDWITHVPKKTKLTSIKEHAVLLKKGKCPRCKARKSELVQSGELVDYYELAGMAGQRGGKTAVVGMFSGYTTHLYIKSPNPPKLFNLTKNMILTGTFAAVTFDQALRNVWNPYVKPNITQSPWFSEYLKMLDFYEAKNGRPLYKVLDTYVFFYHKNLFLSPYTPDRRTLRGATRFLASIDELGHFDSTMDISKSKNSVRANSDETLAALGNSLMTLKNEHRRQRYKGNDTIPNPMMLNVSSPLSKMDGIVRRVEAAKVDPQIYSFVYATWEMSPNYERDDPEIVAAYAVDKVNAARDWGAEPPMSRNAFISNPKIFKHLVNPSKLGMKNAFTVEREKITTATGKKMTGAVFNGIKRKRMNRVLAIDAGSSNNCLAGETKVVTRQGTKSIKNLQGQVEILTDGSKWVTAEFGEYGVQELYAIKLTSLTNEKIVRATANHRWFAYQHRGKKSPTEITTDNLKPGYILESVLPPRENFNINPEGVKHGVVFGDGTKQNDKWSKAYLVDHKIDYLLSYFEEYRTRGLYWTEKKQNENTIVEIRNLPSRWKKLPSTNESIDYLAGFIAGYISTDGCVDTKGCVMLNSTSKKSLVRIRSICNVLGITTSVITKQVSINPYNGQEFTTYKVFFNKSSFDSRLLLNPEHKKRFENSPKGRSVARWKVVSVEKTGVREQTYCANVPVTHSFVLEDYILTGNSFAFAMGRLDPETEVPMLEGLGEVVPYDGRDINFNAMYEEVIAPIIEKYGVTTVAADRWQSKKILHDIEAEFEITADEFSVKLPDFINYRESIFNGGFLMPKPELSMDEILNSKDAYPERFMGFPIAHFIYQNLTVVETIKTVEKGDRLTDDVFRAVVLMHAYLTDPEIKDEFLGVNGEEPEYKRTGLGLVINQGGTNATTSVSGIGATGGKASFSGGGGGRTFSGGRN